MKVHIILQTQVEGRPLHFLAIPCWAGPAKRRLISTMPHAQEHDERLSLRTLVVQPSPKPMKGGAPTHGPRAQTS
eukprot:CAMPEP_0183346320 /NCGR_PEP_ID=MMETSP0164_2-20130417/11478_1 /TAXON_ID=221442 /ORGANISM="Coccolithus pelagicus ssp braarudi, Strain PLY182g" /LENGTH=74 /DNA_ID=CAMNT_0025517577 /DNA_START=45 /DNA_END=269 /DNA_ORIENTATION=-